MKVKKFNSKKISGKSVVHRALIPIGCALAGGIAGSALGAPYNLLGAAVTAAAGLGFENDSLMFGAAGMAVVSPAKTSATTVAGLDGLPEFAAAAKNRAFGFVKNKFINAGLDTVADKIPVSGLGSLEEGSAYEQGYQEGVEQAVGELMGESVDGLGSPYSYGAQNYLAPGAKQATSVDALKALAMMNS